MEGELQLILKPLVDVGEDAQVVLGAQVLTFGLKKVKKREL